MFEIIGESLFCVAELLSDIIIIFIDKGADKIASVIVAHDLKKEEEKKLKDLEDRIKIIIDGKEV